MIGTGTWFDAAAALLAAVSGLYAIHTRYSINRRKLDKGDADSRYAELTELLGHYKEEIDRGSEERDRLRDSVEELFDRLNAQRLTLSEIADKLDACERHRAADRRQIDQLVEIDRRKPATESGR